MKSIRFVLPFALPILLLSCSTPVLAQSLAQKSFAEVKSLAGTWEGTLTTFPAAASYSGGKRYGYMEHVVFTSLGASHHTEDWTFLEPGDHPTRAHFDLHRVR